ncbi:hypothetical protein ACFUIY_37595 [Streptomyces griseorubiginosus]|uniref:hypothetical protein n=1 Tax=Streptomyces griseorubiginosus TaxID=67304 RepID=UPI003631F6C1
MAQADGERTDLSDLVRQRKEELGLSFRALADACVDPERPEKGALWGRSTLDTLTKGGQIKPPTAEKLRALAAGLRLPLSEVREAAGGQYWGVDTLRTEDRKVRAFIRNFEELSPADQEKVWALMEAHRPVRDQD